LRPGRGRLRGLHDEVGHYQLFRLRSEEFLAPWFRQLGVGIESSTLETVLCWPQLRFGGKTIQPDLAVGFERDIVLVEFKRPAGGITPPVEIMGQLCFAADAERQLRKRWHVVLVPGRDRSARTPAEYVRDALAAVDATRAKWAVLENALRVLQTAQPSDLVGRVRVVGWESLLRLSSEAVRASVPESWTRQQALAKLKYFHIKRAALGLLDPPDWESPYESAPAGLPDVPVPAV